MHSKPTHAYIAQKPCGCLSLISSDIPALRAETAEQVARAIIAGHSPGYVTHEAAHALPWRCDRCTAQPAATTPLHLARVSIQPDAPYWRVTGTVTYEVTVPVNAIVQADDAQQATEAAIDAMVEPTCLVVEPEDLTVELHNDDLKATKTALIAAGQLPLELP